MPKIRNKKTGEIREISEQELEQYGLGGKLNKLGVTNSLWNNIRAKKGSGKKPTKEMLKQEAKIKAEEKEFGGMIPIFEELLKADNGIKLGQSPYSYEGLVNPWELPNTNIQTPSAGMQWQTAPYLESNMEMDTTDLMSQGSSAPNAPNANILKTLVQAGSQIEPLARNAWTSLGNAMKNKRTQAYEANQLNKALRQPYTNEFSEDIFGTNQGLQLFADGGRTPIYTSNPNDPRLQAYNDSLRLSNKRKEELERLDKEFKTYDELFPGYKVKKEEFIDDIFDPGLERIGYTFTSPPIKNLKSNKSIVGEMVNQRVSGLSVLKNDYTPKQPVIYKQQDIIENIIPLKSDLLQTNPINQELQRVPFSNYFSRPRQSQEVGQGKMDYFDKSTGKLLGTMENGGINNYKAEYGANVEVEDKELIQLPNGLSDTIYGKTHSEGGEKMNLPQESKVFSEKLKIPIKGKKKSFSKIAKPFETKKDIEHLESSTSDNINKKTAELNIALKNNVLDGIFEIQENAKISGLFGKSVQKEAIQNMEMKYGGKIPKAQEGIKTENTNLKKYPKMPSIEEMNEMNKLSSPINDMYIRSINHQIFDDNGKVVGNKILSDTMYHKKDINPENLPYNFNPSNAGYLPNRLEELMKKYPEYKPTKYLGMKYNYEKNKDFCVDCDPVIPWFPPSSFKNGGLIKMQTGGYKKPINPTIASEMEQYRNNLGEDAFNMWLNEGASPEILPLLQTQSGLNRYSKTNKVDNNTYNSFVNNRVPFFSYPYANNLQSNNQSSLPTSIVNNTPQTIPQALLNINQNTTSTTNPVSNSVSPLLSRNPRVKSNYPEISYPQTTENNFKYGKPDQYDWLNWQNTIDNSATSRGFQVPIAGDENDKNAFKRYGVKDKQGLVNAAYQEQSYDDALDTPQGRIALAKMWEKTGKTLKGKDLGIETKGLTKLNDTDLKDVLSRLRPAYIDSQLDYRKVDYITPQNIKGKQKPIPTDTPLNPVSKGKATTPTKSAFNIPQAIPMPMGNIYGEEAVARFEIPDRNVPFRRMSPQQGINEINRNSRAALTLLGNTPTDVSNIANILTQADVQSTNVIDQVNRQNIQNQMGIDQFNAQFDRQRDLSQLQEDVRFTDAIARRKAAVQSQYQMDRNQGVQDLSDIFKEQRYMNFAEKIYPSKAWENMNFQYYDPSKFTLTPIEEKKKAKYGAKIKIKKKLTKKG